jgi:hypothetical protein
MFSKQMSKVDARHVDFFMNQSPFKDQKTTTCCFRLVKLKKNTLGKYFFIRCW